jgi:hypothetical protein
MLVEFRDVVAHHLAGSPWPVHRYLPDDVAEVPCIAVPRPRLSPGSDSLPVGALTVLVVGNRVGNQSAEDELDEITDLVIARFGGLAKSVRLESPTLPRMTLDDVSPTTVTVAGQTYPAYALTVGALFTSC